MADFIEFQFVGIVMLQRVDVDPVMDHRDRSGDATGGQFDHILTARRHRLLGHPDNVGLEFVCHRR